jgi:hypothetical protein
MNIKFPFWQEVRKLLIDRNDGAFAERVEAYPPTKLMTDNDGDYARLRVDVWQTGFFAGREASHHCQYLKLTRCLQHLLMCHRLQ